MTERPFRTRFLKLRSVLHDRNTGLPAFPLLFDALRTALDDRRAVGVLHVELVDLQMVESLYGWQVFDRVVARVAALLRAAIGSDLPADTLLALDSVAGGRFVLFLPARGHGDPPDARWLAGLAQALSARLDAVLGEALVGLNPKLGARVGHALLTDNPFFRFERCVYAAIEQARSAPERRERRRELSWSEELERIIRTAAIAVVFQPIVEIETQSVLGYEAWARGPAHTPFEAPRALFAFSERVGAGERLDRLCCTRALAAFSGDMREGKLFVNLLAASLDGAGGEPAAALRRSLEGTALEPADVVLEISERAEGVGSAGFLCGLERARSAGFAIAIDDVGTGRLALEALERIRPDYLKLDASLVRRIEGNLIQQEVLRTLVGLAERIGAAVVGEGVETAAEARTLAAGGARYAQGFFWAQPSPAEQVRVKRA